MLLVQLTALVVWIAQYVSAADTHLGPFVAGDIAHVRLANQFYNMKGNELFDPLLLDTSDQSSSDPLALQFTSEPWKQVCLEEAQSFKHYLAVIHNYTVQATIMYTVHLENDGYVEYRQDGKLIDRKLMSQCSKLAALFIPERKEKYLASKYTLKAFCVGSADNKLKFKEMTTMNFDNPLVPIDIDVDVANKDLLELVALRTSLMQSISILPSKPWLLPPDKALDNFKVYLITTLDKEQREEVLDLKEIATKVSPDIVKLDRLVHFQPISYSAYIVGLQFEMTMFTVKA